MSPQSTHLLATRRFRFGALMGYEQGISAVVLTAVQGFLLWYRRPAPARIVLAELRWLLTAFLVGTASGTLILIGHSSPVEKDTRLVEYDYKINSDGVAYRLSDSEFEHMLVIGGFACLAALVLVAMQRHFWTGWKPALPVLACAILWFAGAALLLAVGQWLIMPGQVAGLAALFLAIIYAMGSGASGYIASGYFPEPDWSQLPDR